MRERLADAAHAAGWATVRALPERLARGQFDLIADAVWLRRGRGVRRLQANLRRVLGAGVGERELRSFTHTAVRSYLRYWCEMFRLPAMSRSDVLDRFHVEHADRLWAAVRAGRGVVLVLPHMGNWDLAGAWLVGEGQRFTTVAERLEPASLFDRFVAFRESLGMEVIPLTGAERPPFEVLRERLLAGGVLCLLGDRDLTATGLQVDFFGARARMPAGPAALALDTGAALVPVTMYYPDRRSCRATIHPQVLPPAPGTRTEKIQAMTQQVADTFAAEIAAHPADWHMLQHVWVDDLDASRLAATAEAAV